jgi:regulatory protein RepA
MSVLAPSSKLDIRAILTSKPPVPDHVLPGLPVGAVGGLVAPGGTGKTMFLAQVAVAVASGIPAFGDLIHDAGDKVRTPGRVLLVVAEETADEMHRRLHAVVSSVLLDKSSLFDVPDNQRFLDLLSTNLDVHALAGKPPLVLIEDGHVAPGLRDLREASEGARLVIVDPLRQLHDGDENDSYHMTAVVRALQSVAVGSGCAVLVAHHTSKAATWQGQGDRAGASRGSAAFTDALRWQLNLSQLDESMAGTFGIAPAERPKHVRCDLAKANYIAPRPPQVLRRGIGGALSLVAGDLQLARRTSK